MYVVHSSNSCPRLSDELSAKKHSFIEVIVTRQLCFSLISFSILFSISLAVVAMDSKADRTKEEQSFLDDSLRAAVKHDQFNEIPILLGRGANPMANIGDRFGYESIFERAITRHASISNAEMWLTHGASAQKGLELMANFNTRAHLDLAKLFIDRGAQPSSKLLALSFSRDHLEMSKFLIDSGTDASDLVEERVAANLYRPFFYAYFTVTRNYASPAEQISRKKRSQLQDYLESMGIDENIPCYQGLSLREWKERYPLSP